MQSKWASQTVWICLNYYEWPEVHRIWMNDLDWFDEMLVEAACGHLIFSGFHVYPFVFVQFFHTPSICPPFFHAVRHWGATCFHAFNDAIVLVLAVQSVKIVQNCDYLLQSNIFRYIDLEYVYHSTYIYTCVHIFICTFLLWVIFDVHHQNCMCDFFFVW